MDKPMTVSSWTEFFKEYFKPMSLPKPMQALDLGTLLTTSARSSSKQLIILDSYNLLYDQEALRGLTWRSRREQICVGAEKKYTFHTKDSMETKALYLMSIGRLDYLQSYFTRTGLHSALQVEILWGEIATRSYLPLLPSPFPLSYAGRLTVKLQEELDKRYGWHITTTFRSSISKACQRWKSLIKSLKSTRHWTTDKKIPPYWERNEYHHGYS